MSNIIKRTIHTIYNIPSDVEFLIGLNPSMFGKVVDGILYTKPIHGQTWYNTGKTLDAFTTQYVQDIDETAHILDFVSKVLKHKYSSNKTYHIYKTDDQLYISTHYRPVEKGHKKTLCSGECVKVKKSNYKEIILAKFPELNNGQYVSAHPLGNTTLHKPLHAQKVSHLYKKLKVLGAVGYDDALEIIANAPKWATKYIYQGKFKGCYASDEKGIYANYVFYKNIVNSPKYHVDLQELKHEISGVTVSNLYGQ